MIEWKNLIIKYPKTIQKIIEQFNFKLKNYKIYHQVVDINNNKVFVELDYQTLLDCFYNLGYFINIEKESDLFISYKINSQDEFVIYKSNFKSTHDALSSAFVKIIELLSKDIEHNGRTSTKNKN